jgi:hypothetical protein
MNFHNRVDLERDVALLHLMATANSGDGKFIQKRLTEMQKQL